jgi:hypothetical protein
MIKLLKKRYKRKDLLNVPDAEKIRLLKEVRESLQQKLVEAKLWQSLLEVESLTINGNTVYKSDEPLSGFSIQR